MNGLSVGELCCLFCCPPCPSQIVAKLAFLPPTPTYKLITNNEQTSNSGNSNQSHAPLNVDQTSTHQNSNSRSEEQNSLSNLIQTLRNSSRRLCSSFVCSQQSQQRQQQQQQQSNYQTLFTNAKLVMMEKAEWQYGPVELERLEVFLARTKHGESDSLPIRKMHPISKIHHSFFSRQRS